MTWLDRIAAYLAAQGFGEVGTSIFVQNLPDDEETPDKALAVYYYDGVVLETFGSTDAQPQVQVSLRGAREDRQSEGDRAVAVWQALAVGRGVIEGIELIRPTSYVIPLGEDSQHRARHTVNAQVTFA